MSRIPYEYDRAVVYFSTAVCIIFILHAISIVVLWSQYLSRPTWIFLSLAASYSFLYHRPSIRDHFPSARETRQLSLVRFVCGNLSHFLFVLKVLVGPFSWNIFPIFRYLLSEPWVSYWLSSVFLYFFWELTCYHTCRFSKASLSFVPGCL